MNFKQITSIYFSPTENTKKAVELVAGQLTGHKESLDLTDFYLKRPTYSFRENEAVLAGVPVYGGRVPAAAAQRLKKLRGYQTPAILIVTYGNRHYDDALLELKTVLQQQGFRPLAAAAIVTEHNIVRAVGAGRPDETDRKAIRQFGRRVDELLLSLPSAYQMPPVKVPGGPEYRPYQPAAFPIKVSANCNQCGLCIHKCPVQAISRTDSRIMDRERCIFCTRCIRQCPTRSRGAGPLVRFAAERKIKKMCAKRREAEFFF